MAATLILNVTPLNIFAKSNSNSPFTMDHKNEPVTSTPTPSADEENEDICGLTSEDCKDPASSEAQQAWMNFEVHPSADVVIIS